MDKIAVLFPGQGSHLVGMYSGLYNEYELVRDTVSEAEKVLGREIKKVCFEGTLAELTKPENAHVAIFVFSVASFRVLTYKLGYLPEFLAGHSLGEYAALVCAGVIKFADAIKVIELRSKIGDTVHKELNAAMTIIDNTDVNIAEEVCQELQKQGKKVYISCYNSEKQVALSGLNNDLIVAENIIRNKTGAVINPLFVSAPFHSELMKSGEKELTKMIENLELSEFQIPVLSNYTGKPYTSLQEVKINLVKHIVSPVRWTDIIQYVMAKKINCFIDMSANNVFKVQLEDRMSDKSKIINFSNKYQREEIFKKYENEEAYKRNKFNILTRCLAATVSIKNSNWDAMEYKEKVIGNYQRLIDMKEKYEKAELELNRDVKKKIISILCEILEGKRVSPEEKNYWLCSVLNYTEDVYLLDEKS